MTQNQNELSRKPVPPALRALFYDGVIPAEEIMPQDPRYLSVNHKIESERRHFTGHLPPQEHQRFEALDDLYIESSVLYACACFAYGFRLGARLTGAALTNE